MTMQRIRRQTQKFGDLELRNGPSWPSLETLRTDGAKKLLDVLGPGQVGRLRVRKTEYVLMRTETFNALYGQAQDVHRLQGALVLIRQAAQLVLHLKETQGSGKGVVEKVALEHLYDLAVHFPELATEGQAGEKTDGHDPGASELGDEDDEFELDPARVTRPHFEHYGGEDSPLKKSAREQAKGHTEPGTGS